MGAVRHRIRLTDDEIAAFLELPHKVQLATINSDGTPHLVTMYYAMFDGRLGFWTYRTSQKAANLRRDPRVACLVESGTGYDQLVGVLINGVVEATDDLDEVERIGREVYGRYVALDGESLRPFIADQARKRTAYLVTPTKVASWDHRKIAAAYAAESTA